jgi:long-chain acyl-CoA synthetase
MTMYGATETAPLETTLPGLHHLIDAPQVRSCGRPMVGVEVRIAGDDGGDAPRGEVGEVTVRGPNVMAGYWRKPEQTAAVLRDGWFSTGDLGYLDDDGYLYLVDRAKDMIVTGGENVYSAEVENALARHPAVLECAVIGIPHEKWGEAVHAEVRLRDGQAVDQEALTQHCLSLISSFKQPRSYNFRAQPLPLSAAGKVLKNELRKAYWEGSERRVA